MLQWWISIVVITLQHLHKVQFCNVHKIMEFFQNGTFIEFGEFSKFRESYKSLKYE